MEAFAHGGDALLAGGIRRAVDKFARIRFQIVQFVLRRAVPDVFPTAVANHPLAVKAELIAVVHAMDVFAAVVAFALQHRQDALPLERFGHFRSRHFAKRTGQIDRVDNEIVTARARFRHAQPADNERHTRHVFIHDVMFVDHAVGAEHVAMVAGIDDDGVVR